MFALAGALDVDDNAEMGIDAPVASAKPPQLPRP
jgi:hypothetical protein